MHPISFKMGITPTSIERSASGIECLTNQAVPFDNPDVSNGLLSAPSLGAAALSGNFTVNGQKVRTVFDVIKDHYKQYTPEWAEKLTDISAATIRRITAELVDAAQIGSTIDINGFTFPYRPGVSVRRSSACAPRRCLRHAGREHN